MSNKRYIEFDSTYRNRNCYPCPADFTVKVTCAKDAENGLTANDYVANEYPQDSWYQVPYAGSTSEDLVNKKYVLNPDPDVNLGVGGVQIDPDDPSTIPDYYPDLTTDIPIVINGKSYASMWPIDWMNGASPTYFSNLETPASFGVGTGPLRIGSGAASITDFNTTSGDIVSFGTRFDGTICNGTAANTYYTPNITMSLPPLNSTQEEQNGLNAQFWMSAAIRNRNILAPEKFSGGTASAPQLGPKSIEQGKFDNYFTGAMLFRFTVNPLYDTNTALGGSTGTADGTSGAGALLGSLGFPYYYQKLSFAVPPPTTVSVGAAIGGQNTSGVAVRAYVACVISQQEIIVRLGGEIPISPSNVPNIDGTRLTRALTTNPPENVFPGVPPNLEPIYWNDGKNIEISTTNQVTIANPPSDPPVLWGIPTSGSRPFPAYFWCGFVESAIIQSYDSATGLVTLDQPFLSSGSNSFDTSNDYYLIDFDSDPSGHWNKTSQPYANINSGKPRVFFPGGAAIPNYYSGRAITSISREIIQSSSFGLRDTVISNYDFTRRVLFLNKALEPESPGFRGVQISSQYTLLFLDNGIGETLPIGSFIAWNGSGAGAGGGTNDTPSSGSDGIPMGTTGSPQTGDRPGLYYVAVTAPKGATCIVLQGARNPQTPCAAPTCYRTTSPLNMLGLPLIGGGGITQGTKTDQPSASFGSVQVPPFWNQSVLDYWRDPTNWSELLPGTTITGTPGNQSTGCWPLGLGSLLGAQTILARGKLTVPIKNNFIPYTPMSSISVPEDSPLMLKNNGVVTLEVSNGGLGYKITEPSKPIMALISLPTNPDAWTYVSTNQDPFSVSGSFAGMKPKPEFYIDAFGNYIYTFANLCFVNVTSVGAGGQVLEVSVNCPGEGYPRGTQVFLLDGFTEASGVPTTVDTYDAKNDTPAEPKWVTGPGSGCTCVVTDTAPFLGLAGDVFPGKPRPGDLAYITSYGYGLRSTTSRTLYNSAPEVGEFILNYSGNTSSTKEYYLEEPQIPPTIQNCLADEETFPETGTRVITASIRSRNSQILIKPHVYNWTPGGPATNIYHSIQYAAPGAYFGGYFGFEAAPGRREFSGKNSILWLALDKNIAKSNCVDRFAFESDSYVNGNYSFTGSGLAAPGALDYSNLGELLFAPLIPQGIPRNSTSATFPNLGQWSDARFYPMGSNQISVGEIQGSLQLSNTLTGNWLQLLTFDRDNEYPLNYTGSTVSQNQMVCYEVELISLILPNLPLDNSIGGLIAFYPYLYVELTNVTSPSGGNAGIIYSNNPNAQKALFRVAIDDTPTPVISKFIKVDGDGAVQTVKFKPNDNLKIRIYLADGTLFETQTKDTTPPSIPDPFVQISAQFSIRRLT